MRPVAVIGGTGLNTMPDFQLEQERIIKTPYGSPSAALQFGRLSDQSVCFLPRHGLGHKLAPHSINYRANIWALHEAGIEAVIAVAAVGGIRKDMTPGSIAIPDQIIDYTWGRAHSFYDADSEQVADAGLEHIEFDPPYDEALRQRLLAAAASQGIDCIADGCYACTQGPRLETAAEIRRLQRDGADMVGMTGMPEAALAREAGLAYACLAVMVNWAAGLGSDGQAIHAQIEQALTDGMGKTQSLLRAL